MKGEENSQSEREPVQGISSVFEHFSVLAKAVNGLISWPLIVLIVLLANGPEVTNLLQVLPDLLKNSTQVEIGSFKLSLAEVAKQKSDPKLAEAVKGLSGDAIALIFEANERSIVLPGAIRRNEVSNRIVLPSGKRIAGIKELLEKDLIKVVKGDLGKTLDRIWGMHLKVVQLPDLGVKNGPPTQILEAESVFPANVREDLIVVYKLTPAGLQIYSLILDYISKEAGK